MEFNPIPDFCKIICQSPINRVCTNCLAQIDSHSGENRYVCEYGLENVYIPIVVGGQTLGYVIGLQAFSSETEYKKYLFDLVKINEETGIPIENLAKALASVETVDNKEIRIYQQICEHVAGNIALDVQEKVIEGGQDVQRLSIEKEILEKKIIDLETKNDSLVINPHFLFNTLNSIARTAYFEQSYTTEELIYCLSDLLRYTLKQENQLHTIETELDYIQKYLHIQKVRFKDRLNYEIEIPDNLRFQHILNMTLQPIVENALVHGITPKRDGGKIKIYAVNADAPDTIEICVEDNGNGFSKKVLSELAANVNDKMSLGFRSTDRRLKQYFGQEYGLFITKSDFSGSIVTVKIPKKS